MKTYKKLLMSLSCMAVFSACNDDVAFTPDYPYNITVDSLITAKINMANTFQTIEGFGASGAWTFDFVGKYWSDKEKSEIAKLLFSSEIKDGKPEGIGLSQWRVNIGGGTAEQGDASGIDGQYYISRRVECFMNSDGTYDWTKSIGQQYFMEQAKNYGCNNFTLFSCTPPVYYTKNGKGWSSNGAYANLQNDKYTAFAEFLATVAQHFTEKGYNISYISPVNEPEYNWGDNSNQEGSGWQNTEVARLARELDTQLTAKGLNNTKMLISEAAKWFYLYQATGDGRGNVLDAYFNPSSTDTYIGNLNHLAPVICSHSYFTDENWNTLTYYRNEVNNKVQQYTKNGEKLRVHQTEWSMMGASYEDCPDYANSVYMDLSLAMSKVIHQDLATANVTSWSYWTSAYMEQWSQLNRFYLIRLSPEGGDYGDLAAGGTFSAGKNLWVLGNYSLFIRPGYQRIELNIPDSDNKFFGTSYLSPEKDKLVIVYTNCHNKSIKITNEVEGIDLQTTEYEQYVTSNYTDLKKSPSYEKGIIPARSVVTFVYSLK